MEYRITAKGILHENDKILFVEYEFNNDLFYSLPGGEQKIGESLKECVRREFAEEAKIDIIVDKLIFVNEFIDKDNKLVPKWQNGIHQIENIFLVRRAENSTLIYSEKKDSGMAGLKWFSQKELAKVNYYPKIKSDWFFKLTYSDLSYKINKNL